MAEKKSNALYYISITLAAFAFCFFGYMKLFDVEIFIFNRIIGCYTICFTAITAFLLIRIYAIYKTTKKVNYQLWLMILSASVSGICLINSVAEDFGKSKTKIEIIVNEATNVYLCERNISDEHTKIEVYRVRDRLAKKLGEIDETPFAVRCIAGNKCKWDISEDGVTLNVHCEYGTYSDETVNLKPELDDGTLSYSFTIN